MYEYGEDGRAEQAISHREAEWSDDDRDLMTALAWVEADECVCGLPLSQTTASRTDEDYRVPPPQRCQACTAIARSQATLEQYKPEFPHALRWSIQPKD